jgi:hypothetical protein
MIVIQHDASGQRFNYHTAPVTDDPRNPVNYTLPKGYSLASDQTPADDYLVLPVNEETGQYVETRRWPIDIDPLA